MVAGDRGNGFDLLGRKAGQVGVGDQVIRVPVVLRASDGISDVMQERRVLQQFALGGRELMERVGLVEELESESGNLSGVEELGVGPP